MITLEISLRPKLNSPDWGSETGCQSGSQLDSQGAPDMAVDNALNECVSICKAYLQLRQPVVCQLPVMYSSIVQLIDIYKPTIDGFRLCVVQGSTEIILWAIPVWMYV